MTLAEELQQLVNRTVRTKLTLERLLDAMPVVSTAGPAGVEAEIERTYCRSVSPSRSKHRTRTRHLPPLVWPATRTRLSNATSELTAKNSALTDRTKKLFDAETQLAKTNTAFSSTTTDLSKARVQLTATQADLALMTERLATTKQQLADSEVELANTMHKLTEAKAQVRQIARTAVHRAVA